MDHRDQHSSRNQEPLDPERAAARHGDEERTRNAGGSMRDAMGENRFRGDEGRGERGYRGHAGADTPPGGVPGGSYGGGGGYRQGGYERGNFDPGIEMSRAQRGWARGEGGRQGGRSMRNEPPAYGGFDEYRSAERGAGQARGPHMHGPERGPDRNADRHTEQGGYGGGYERGEWGGGQTGDWRRGYGGYGMSEGGMGAGAEMYGWDPQEEPGGYGLGRGEGPRWGEEGPANRGSQGRGSFRGEQQWNEGSQQDDDDDRHGWERGRSDSRGGSREEWMQPGPHTGRGPENYQRSEEAIRADVCERLTRHGRLDASRIRVLVEQGEVILEGKVDSRVAKRMAEDTAETVAGVRDVQNRLRIDDRSRDDER